MIAAAQLGRILVEHGVVSEAQLEQALAHQQAKGCRLGEALVQSGFCTELEIARALAEQMDLRFIDLEQTPPSQRMLRLVPKEIAHEYGAIPVRLEGDRLVVAARNPLDIRIDAAFERATGRKVIVGSACEPQLKKILDHYEELKWLGVSKPAAQQRAAVTTSAQAASAQLVASTESAATVQMVDAFMAHALRRSSTEIWFEPHNGGLRVRGRIDGHMYSMGNVAAAQAKSVIGRLKVMNGIPLDQQYQSRTGSCTVRVDGLTTDLDCSAVVGADGEIISLKKQAKELPLLQLPRLGMEPEVEQIFRRAMLARRGMILVSGIADSGLSSTLYSLLEELALQKLKVISVEAEVQCRVPGVNQLVTQDRTGASFSCTLQLALNHAPDVVMVSELPDRQTAEVACRAAMEGRLVLAGSHSPTAFGALCRLLDLGIAPNEVAAALAVISSQRLLRKNCISCARPQTLGFDMEKALRAHFGSLDGMEFKRGRGCEKCFQLGHRGRTAVWEMVEVNEDIRYLLSDRFPPSAIEDQFRKNGFRTLEEDALIKAGRGTIAPDEIGELRLGIAAALTDLAARLPVGPKEDLESLAAMDTSAWEIQPEEEVTSWDELASLVDTLN